MGLQLLFLVQIEDLKGPLLRLKRDDLPTPVHDCTIGLDWPAHDSVVMLEIDDDDLRLSIFGDFLAYANIVI